MYFSPRLSVFDDLHQIIDGGAAISFGHLVIGVERVIVQGMRDRRSHPDYKMTEGYRRTTVDDLMKIVEYGKSAGLNTCTRQPPRPGRRLGKHAHAIIGQATVIRRYGFLVQQNRVGPDGNCPDCHKPLPAASGANPAATAMAACGRCSKADAPIAKHVNPRSCAG